ncbi:terminase small subunit [Pseudomonas koreensis]|uniref:terminase small subunit n=1 Tax=Pseudomonas koreensis TaxID=198620 RepID=UPI0021C6C9C0|nr:terminase small subunit [Pseudomonas koreensis]MCU0092232.1 terminase small subunit [Pseudomonas koreensis]
MAFLTRKEYGELKGWSKQHISKLILNNRLVLDEAGLIDVDASEQFLAMTRDPSKAGVSARHVEDKQRKVPIASTPIQAPVHPSLPVIPDYQRSRARREHAQAEQIESQVRKENGSLVEVDVVDKAAFEAGRMLRDLLLGMPPQIASELVAMTDPWDIEQHLTAAIRRTLEDAERMAASDLSRALSTKS